MELKTNILDTAVYPYSTQDPDTIDRFLQEVVESLKNSEQIEVEAEFDHYGSGYASYVEVFCDRRQPSQLVSNSDSATPGITLYLSRLLPIVVYGATEKAANSYSGTFKFLTPHQLGLLPPGDWQGILTEITQKLQSFNLQIISPSAEEFQKLFYWED